MAWRHYVLMRLLACPEEVAPAELGFKCFPCRKRSSLLAGTHTMQEAGVSHLSLLLLPARPWVYSAVIFNQTPGCIDHIQETRLHLCSEVSRKNNGSVRSIATSWDDQARDVKVYHYPSQNFCCVLLAASNHVK